MVMSERFRDTALLHNEHRDTIHDAPTLIKALRIPLDSRAQPLARLGDYKGCRIDEKTRHKACRLLPRLIAPSRERVEHLHEHSVCCHQARVFPNCQVIGVQESLFVGSITLGQKRNEVLGVSEDLPHSVRSP